MIWTDDRHDLGRVAAGDPFELGGRIVARINPHTALRSTMCNVNQGALPRHPHRERTNFVEVYLRAVAPSALGRSARVVVLEAVADQDLDLAVVAPQRNADGELAPRHRE